MTLLSVEAAARRGVIEAKIWDRTGVPPANPEHRLQDIPFRPEEGFVGGRVRRLSLFVRLAQVHAPKGGVSIGGKKFKGGEFIPGEDLAKATPEEKAKIEGTGSSESQPSAGKERWESLSQPPGKGRIFDFISDWVRISSIGDKGKFDRTKGELLAWVEGESKPQIEQVFQDTQRQLKEAGVGQVSNAMRGISLSPDHPLHQALAAGKLKPGDEFTLSGGDAGSWTEDFNTAGRSAGPSDSVIIERTIDASDIIASHRTQKGFFRHEAEILAKNPPQVKVRIKASIINGKRLSLAARMPVTQV